MLTSFLSKSRPGNLFIFATILVLGYFMSVLSHVFSPDSLVQILKHLAMAGICILFLLLFNFILEKNKITGQNIYGAFFFTIYWLMFPMIFLEINIFFANFFLLLALRRMLSLGKDTNAAKKILDAGVWISVAALFHFWCFLFLIPLWILIIQKPNRHYKQLLMPLISIFMVMMIATSTIIILKGSLSWFRNWIPPLSLDFSAYNKSSLLISSTVFFGFIIWTSMTKLMRMPKYALNERPKQFSLLNILLITTLIALGVPTKTGAELFQHSEKLFLLFRPK